MMILLNQLLNILWPLFLMFGAAFGINYVQKVKAQKRRNALNELDLTAKKIDFANHTKPIAKLLADSNSSHAVGPTSGNDDSEE